MEFTNIISEMRRRIFTTIIIVCLAIAGSRAANIPFNVVIMGDSNAALGGDSCTVDRGWTKWYREAAKPVTCISYARIGATWTNNALTRLNITENKRGAGNNNVIYNQVSRFKEAYKNGDQPEPALIIIAAGTCDAWFESQRPEMYSLTVDKAFKTSLQDLMMKKVNQVTSLAESIRFNCEILRESFPDSRIVLLTPVETTVAGEARNQKVSNIIEECAKRLDVEVIRLDKVCNIKCNEERIKKHYTVDGSNTSVVGAQLIAERVFELLNK